MIIEDLLDGCKNGNTQAQEQLFKALAPKLFGLCLKYSSNYAEAEDHLQDAFMVIFQKIDQFSNKGSLEGWCKRITIHVCLQSFRKNKKLEVVSDYIETASEEEVFLEEESEQIPKEVLLQMIQELPKKYQMVFNLYVFEEYSHKEIAEVLQIGESGSKSNLFRARQILKQKIEAYLAKQQVKAK
ncbi:MAG: RNA polymerase sigma factor [Flavobacterium sp.]